MKINKSTLNEINLSFKFTLDQILNDLYIFKKDKTFIIIFIFGCILRLIHLSQPIRGDEAATFLSYVEPINPFRVFVYTYPNNHIFHTILVKITSLIFGFNLVSLRLPAFLASIGSIYLIYAICKRFNQSGFLGALSLAFWPYLIAYAVNSRGYSLVCFLSLTIIYLYLIFRRNLSDTSVVIISLIGALGMLTLPTFLIVLVGIYFFILFDYCFVIDFKKIKSHRLFILLSSLTSIFSICLYLPVFILSPLGHNSVLNNKWVENLPYDVFFNSLRDSFISTIYTLSQSLPTFYLYSLLALFTFGLYSYFYDKKIFEFSLFPLILFSSILIVCFKQVLPPGRVWIFLIPYFLIVADNGFTKIYLRIKTTKKNILLTSLVIYLLIIINPFLNNKYITIDDPIFPEAEQAVKYLESQRITQGKDQISSYLLSGSSMPLNYYNWLHDYNLNFNNERIYRKIGKLDSLKNDLNRFRNSNWKKVRNKNIIDFYIVNNRYKKNKEAISKYNDLKNNYPLVMKASSLEIYSSKKID